MSTMSRSPTLPPEIRTIVYRHVAHGAKVKFSPGKPLSTCGALLVCCKTIRDEFLPIFYEEVRIDFSARVDRNTGAVQLPNIELGDLRHVKLEEHVFAGEVGMDLLRSMSNLVSLTFPCDTETYVYGCSEWPQLRADCHCDYCSSRLAAYVAGRTEDFEDAALNDLKEAIEGQTTALIGTCPCHDPDGQGHVNCPGDTPRRKVIAVWQFLRKPFKLNAEVEYSIDGNDKYDDLIDMVRLSLFLSGSGMLTESSSDCST
jgi:hypothetical protein